jgi:hypothetical protein
VPKASGSRSSRTFARNMKTPRYLFSLIILLSVVNLPLSLYQKSTSQLSASWIELSARVPPAIASAILIISIFGYVAALLYERRWFRK